MPAKSEARRSAAAVEDIEGGTTLQKQPPSPGPRPEAWELQSATMPAPAGQGLTWQMQASLNAERAASQPETGFPAPAQPASCRRRGRLFDLRKLERIKRLSERNFSAAKVFDQAETNGKSAHSNQRPQPERAPRGNHALKGRARTESHHHRKHDVERGHKENRGLQHVPVQRKERGPDKLLQRQPAIARGGDQRMAVLLENHYLLVFVERAS